LDLKSNKLGLLTTKIGSGITPRGGQSVYQESGTYLIRSQNIYNHKFKKKGLVCISQEIAEKMKSVEIMKDDVLINITGDSVARVYLVPDEVLPARVNQHVCILRTTPELNPHYLYYFLINSITQKHLLSIAGIGGTRNALTKEMLYNLIIEYPNYPTQEKIVKQLNVIKNKIITIQDQNETIEQMAQSIFKSWFVDFDGVTEWDDTELGSIPKGWTIEKLHDQCRQIVRGHNTKYVEKSNLINLNQKANRGNYLDDSYFKYLDDNSKIPLEKFGSKKDILINSLGEGTLGRIHMFLDDRKNIVIDQHITIVRVNNEKIFPEYLYFFLTYPVHNTRLQNQITGSTKMSMLNISSVRDFTIIVPEKKIQKKFSERISQLYSKKYSNIKQIRNLSHIRDSSLPKLMSGEIQV
jgi:type I restriction enzyme, S subunit